MDEIPEWQKRLESAIAKNVQQRTVKSKLRAEMAERRAYGKASYHAARLAKAKALIDAKVEAGELERLPGGLIREVKR